MNYAKVNGVNVSAVDYGLLREPRPSAICDSCKQPVTHVGSKAPETFEHFRHLPGCDKSCKLATSFVWKADAFSKDSQHRANALRLRCMKDRDFRRAIHVEWRHCCKGDFDFAAEIKVRIKLAERRDLWSYVGVSETNIAWLLLTLSELHTRFKNGRCRQFVYKLRKARNQHDFRPNAAKPLRIDVCVVENGALVPSTTIDPILF